MGFMARQRENCAGGGAIVEQKARIWPTNSLPKALMLRALYASLWLWWSSRWGILDRKRKILP